MRPSRIVREPTPVAFLRTRDDAAAISRDGRNSRMSSTCVDASFSVSSSLPAPNIAHALRFGRTTTPSNGGARPARSPGGLYLRVRLRGKPPGIYEQIAPRMAELEAPADRDEDRPLIEFYRRRDEIDLLVPARV
jgi:hypothetical protein